MMSTTTFDTQYAKKLRQAGFTEAQAEIQAEALLEVVEDHFATKSDLKELERATKNDIRDLEKSLTIKMGGMMITSVSLVSLLMSFLSRFH